MAAISCSFEVIISVVILFATRAPVSRTFGGGTFGRRVYVEEGFFGERVVIRIGAMVYRRSKIRIRLRYRD
jgi:hypothetical protein